MSAEEINEKIQHLVDRMNAKDMEVVEPLEMFTLRRELVTLYNQMAQLSD